MTKRGIKMKAAYIKRIVVSSLLGGAFLVGMTVDAAAQRNRGRGREEKPQEQQQQENKQQQERNVRAQAAQQRNAERQAQQEQMRQQREAQRQSQQQAQVPPALDLCKTRTARAGCAAEWLVVCSQTRR